MNKRLSMQARIYIALGLWLAVVLVMFGYGFKFMDKSNSATRDKIQTMNKELLVLESEKESYDMAKRDLAMLQTKPVQPEDFFSRDTTLVNEIEYLESLANKLGLQMALSGLSGTVKTATKAKTNAEILMVPYNITINGQFSNIVQFIEYMENLPFVTQLSALAINAADKGSVNAGLSANFYLKK